MISSSLIGDRYQILKPLGRGGLGQTYLAQDTQRNQSCALKEFAPHPNLPRAALAKAEQLFHREAKVLRSLHHPQIPAYIDALSWQGAGDPAPRLFLVQQYIDGQTYQQHLQRRPFTEQQTLQFFQDMLPVLAYLHNHHPQVIHRDIAPDNIIFDPNVGKPVLLDFGSVKQAIANATQFPNPAEQQVSNKRSPKTIIAKEGFTAPEQAHGLAYPNSDLYALGMSAISLLTGNPNPIDVAPHHWQQGLSPEATELIQRLSHPYPKERYSSAEEALASVNRLLGTPASPPQQLPLTSVATTIDHRDLESESNTSNSNIDGSTTKATPVSPEATQSISTTPAAKASQPAANQPTVTRHPPVSTPPVSNQTTVQVSSDARHATRLQNSLTQPAELEPEANLPQTIAVGRPSPSSDFPTTLKEIYPWYIQPFVQGQSLLAFLLYRLVAPSIALLCVFGLGRAAVMRILLPEVAQWQLPSLPTLSLPQISLPQISLPKPNQSSKARSGKDCRKAVLERADRFESVKGIAPNWDEVDQRFRNANPSFTAAIDPENPDHKPYVQSWCGIAEQWFDEELGE